jgi:hypothetical protein
MLWLTIATWAALSAAGPGTPDLFGDDAAEEVLPEAPLPTTLALGSYPGDELVQIRGRAWFARLSGTVEANGTTRGSRLSVSSDTDLGGHVDVPQIEASINIPYVGRLYLGWWGYSNSSNPTLDRTITFADHTFNTGTQIHTKFDLNVIYAMYEYAFPKISLGDVAQLELGLELGIRAISGHLEMSDAGQDSTSEGTIPALVLGGRAILQFLPWLRAEVEAVGIGISIDAEKVTYVETFAEVVFQPLPWLFGGVGYQYMQMTYRYNARLNFDLDLDLSGAYVTVGVRF